MECASGKGGWAARRRPDLTSELNLPIGDRVADVELRFIFREAAGLDHPSRLGQRYKLLNISHLGSVLSSRLCYNGQKDASADSGVQPDPLANDFGKAEGERKKGGYPKGFHDWPLERRNPWFAGSDVDGSVADADQRAMAARKRRRRGILSAFCTGHAARPTRCPSGRRSVPNSAFDNGQPLFHFFLMEVGTLKVLVNGSTNCTLASCAMRATLASLRRERRGGASCSVSAMATGTR